MGGLNHPAQEVAHFRTLSFIPRKNYKQGIFKWYLFLLSFVIGRLKVDNESLRVRSPVMYLDLGKGWWMIQDTDVAVSSERLSHWKRSPRSRTVVKSHMLWSYNKPRENWLRENQCSYALLNCEICLPFMQFLENENLTRPQNHKTKNTLCSVSKLEISHYVEEFVVTTDGRRERVAICPQAPGGKIDL